MRVFLSPAILKNRRVTVFDYLPDDLEVLGSSTPWPRGIFRGG
jgi:hypothetical protein